MSFQSIEKLLLKEDKICILFYPEFGDLPDAFYIYVDNEDEIIRTIEKEHKEEYESIEAYSCESNYSPLEFGLHFHRGSNTFSFNYTILTTKPLSEKFETDLKNFLRKWDPERD